MVRPVRPLLALLLTATLAVGVVAAAPPPSPLCDACGDGFEAAANEHGVSLTVTHSDALVTVHEDGSADWRVTNHLATDASAQRLREDDALLRDIARRGYWDAEFVSARVSENTVVLRYREPDFAQVGIGGALVSNVLTGPRDYSLNAGLGADELTVVGPPETTVAWTPPNAGVEHDRFTVRAADPGYLAFEPTDSVVPWGAFSVVAAALPAPATGLLALALPVVALAALAALGARATGHRLRDPAPARALLAATGALLALLAVPVTDWLPTTESHQPFGPETGAAAVIFLGVAFLAVAAFGPRLFDRERDYGRALVASVGVFVVAWFAAVLVAAEFGHTLSVATSGPLFAGLLALFPAGYAVGTDQPRFAAPPAALAAVLVGVYALPSLSTALSLDSAVGVAVAAGVVVGIALVGLPALVAGVALGAE